MRVRRVPLVALLVTATLTAGAAPADAAFPGGNGKITFRVFGTHYFRTLFSVEPDGTGVTPLTDPDFLYTPAAWSPDGTQMAFVRYRKANTKLQIADAEAADPSTVLVDEDLPKNWQLTENVTWMPDGQRLVVGLNNAKLGNVNLFVIGVDGSGLTRLSGKNRYDVQPAVSNDGATIAFMGVDDRGRFQLMLMDVDGTHRRFLDVGGKNDRGANPDWAPDDSAIVFERYDGTQTDLFTIQPDGSALTQLTDTHGWEQDPAFSPDGDLVVYQRPVGDPNRPTDLWTITVVGAMTTRLTESPERWEESPAWQPLPT